MSLRAHSRFATYMSALSLVTALLCSTASAEWKEKVLYSFQGTPDGALPAGGVVFDAAGNLYGATTDGGAFSCAPTQCGTVFQLARPAKTGDPWKETVLHIFQGNASGDGNTPTGGLVIDSSGNLYGTTAYGGTGNCILLGGKVGCGTVYKLSPPKQKQGTWTEQVLYSFQSGKDGYLPSGDLVFDTSGNLYGATEYGGGYGSCNAPYYQYCGTIFQLSPPKTKTGKWKEKVLYSFKGVKPGQQSGDGANPNGGLALDSKGAIYGTTYFGGNNQQGICEGGVGGTGCGIVFELIPPANKGGAWTKKTVHRFNAQDGSNPAAGVVFDRNGNLYGTTFYGPGPYGLVFELKKQSRRAYSWVETVLHPFSGGNGGGSPMAGIVLDANGNLYGATHSGGVSAGTIYRLNGPSQQGGPWTFRILYGFMGSPDGAQPAANLIFDSNGNLYSTTQYGGTGACSFYGCGTVFEASP